MFIYSPNRVKIEVETDSKYDVSMSIMCILIFLKVYTQLDVRRLVQLIRVVHFENHIPR